MGLRQLAGVGHDVSPPRHNFKELPRIRSERPAFELHYPHMVERMREEAHFSLTHPGKHKVGKDEATEKALASTERDEP